MSDHLLHLRIISPKKVIYEADVLAVSSKNKQGKFDILAGHANYIGLIEKESIIVRTPDKKNLSFQFPIAILYVKNNNISIYTEIQLS